MKSGSEVDAGETGSERRGTRARMVDSAVALLRERSAAAVTIDAVLARSGAPRGSVYHHFPGGRDQIVFEAVELAGGHVAGLIRSSDPHDPSAVVTRLLQFWQRVLESSDYFAGCPVVALTVDAHDRDDAAAHLVHGVFTQWRTELGHAFAAGGIPTDRARRLATLTIAAAEGAVLLARAHRSAEPLDDVAAELQTLLAAAGSG